MLAIYNSLDNCFLSKRIAIVGSGQFTTDLSSEIDSCDLVLRFNECKNYGKNCGKKTDILCVRNSGLPADRMIEKKSIFNSDFYPLVSEVWFPRDVDVVADKSNQILISNNLSDRRWVRLGKDLNVLAYDLLQRESNVAFGSPSTGFFGILNCLSDLRFRIFKKMVVGFSFKGAACHPWLAEERIIRNFSNIREDFDFIDI